MSISGAPDEVVKRIMKAVRGRVRLDETLRMIGESVRHAPKPEDRARMLKFANEIYDTHFAGKEPRWVFAIFVGGLLSILAENVAPEEEVRVEEISEAEAKALTEPPVPGSAN